MSNISTSTGLSDRGKGILMSIGGVFVLSPDSLLIRLADLDDFTLIFYRGLFPIFAIGLFLWLYYRSRLLEVLLAIGWAGILNGVFFAAVNITFISAIQRTSVANTLLFLSSAPIFAAVLSLIVLRENQRLSTWLSRQVKAGDGAATHLALQSWIEKRAKTRTTRKTPAKKKTTKKATTKKASTKKKTTRKTRTKAS